MLSYPLRFFFVALYKCWLALKQTLRPSGGVLELDVEEITEQPSPLSWFGGSGTSLFTYRDILQRAAEDPNIDGIIIRAGDLGSTGFAHVEELRELFRQFSRSGKFLIAFLDTTSTRGYYLASICDRIFMCPSGTLGPLGLHLQQTFLRGTFEKLGIEPRLERQGEYKSAAEMFERKDISDEHKEMMNWILDELYEEVIQEIHVRRGIGKDELQKLFDEGFLDASAAEEAGLVDDLRYEEGVDEWMEQRVDREEMQPVEERRYIARTLPSEVSWRPPTRIGVLYADGPIHDGEGKSVPKPTVGSRTLSKTFRDIRRRGGYDGLLFRVNSPGGSAVASDKIARGLQRLREEEELPVVTSMGGVAASGGYYVSALADPIYANRTTLTGSIGVVMGKFDVSELQEKAGVRTNDMVRGKRADMLSAGRGWKRGEKNKLTSMMERTYDQFVDVVEEGRDRDREEILDVAEGKVWTGRQARENGLVDETGGFNRALRHLRSKMGLPEHTPIKLVPLPQRNTGLLNALTGTVLNQLMSRLETLLFR